MFESFSFQVAPLEHLTLDGLRTALEMWAERNYPDLALPTFVLDPWVDPSELSRGLLEELLSQVAGEMPDEAPPDLVPDLEVLEPAYEAA